ncbi:hypothetical protein ACHAWF_002636 [Thalassiosira exigua]
MSPSGPSWDAGFYPVVNNSGNFDPAPSPEGSVRAPSAQTDFARSLLSGTAPAMRSSRPVRCSMPERTLALVVGKYNDCPPYEIRAISGRGTIVLAANRPCAKRTSMVDVLRKVSTFWTHFGKNIVSRSTRNIQACSSKPLSSSITAKTAGKRSRQN